MERLVLVSHHLCPYVQRAAIALTEKGVGFERRMIELSQRPDWFNAASPLGKVPILLVGTRETAIFESAVILEYLEETQVNPLHPADPVDRARHRAWIEFGSATLNAIGRMYSAEPGAAFERECDGLATLFGRIEAELAARPGPWFAGHSFSLVDAVYAPVFRYFDVFEALARMAILDDMPRIAAWRKALAAAHLSWQRSSPTIPIG